MKSIALALLLLGIVLITISYTKQHIKCPPPRIQYRFIPQSILDEQLNAPELADKFGKMFENKDTWFGEDVTYTNSTNEPLQRGSNFMKIES